VEYAVRAASADAWARRAERGTRPSVMLPTIEPRAPSVFPSVRQREYAGENSLPGADVVSRMTGGGAVTPRGIGCVE